MGPFFHFVAQHYDPPLSGYKVYYTLSPFNFRLSHPIALYPSQASLSHQIRGHSGEVPSQVELSMTGNCAIYAFGTQPFYLQLEASPLADQLLCLQLCSGDFLASNGSFFAYNSASNKHLNRLRSNKNSTASKNARTVSKKAPPTSGLTGAQTDATWHESLSSEEALRDAAVGWLGPPSSSCSMISTFHRKCFSSPSPCFNAPTGVGRGVCPLSGRCMSYPPFHGSRRYGETKLRMQAVKSAVAKLQGDNTVSFCRK